ncbi:hypothetical protein [Niveispirillum fermenti]|uniref:hypothetical protein n=1 Tax=Niveispirillum fermenti TaxID=1233113 RepID=UPI00404187B2
MRQAMMDRRLLLRGAGSLLATALLPVAALAEGAGADDPKLRFIELPPLMLPGRERYSFIRLTMRLVVRRSPKLPAELALATAYRPRIIGLLTEQLPEDANLTRNATPDDLVAVKQHVRTLANDIIGQPVIEDVLIMSFLTG